MKVVSYHSGIPTKNNSPEKPLILSNFVQGVASNGEEGINHYKPTVLDCDVAVIQGYVHEDSKQTPHLLFRKRVIDHQRVCQKRTLIVDSNLFLYANGKSNKLGNYLRYSFDGVFRGTGFYFDKDVDPNRWQSIKNTIGIDLIPYKARGNNILLCLQRNGGWSIKKTNVINFAHNAIKSIKNYTSKKIIVRGHPGDRKTLMRLKELKYPNVEISQNQDIRQDLKDAWATVVYNSSPGVASLIQGVPVFQMDPQLNYSMYGEVANTNLENIEDPILFDRQEWIERISMCHWSFDELKDGTAWRFMRNYV